MFVMADNCSPKPELGDLEISPIKHVPNFDYVSDEETSPLDLYRQRRGISHHGSAVKNKDVFEFQSPNLQSKVSTPGGVSRKFAQPLMMSSPSPAPKMPGNGARNELYQKSVFSSPYNHKTYTPMSATPAGFSPAFRTPLRSCSNNGPGQMCTPDSSKNRYRQAIGTPQRGLVPNPFDNGTYDHLDGPLFMSPGVFSMASTPSTDEKKPFKWSIEHMAELHPVDIEEMPKQQAAHVVSNRDAETRAQMAIEKFFANNLIAPSPWSDQSKVKKKIVTTPDTDERLPKSCINPDLQGSIQKQLPQKPCSQDACCQTVLSLPVDFDVVKVLGQYLTQQTTNEDANPDFLSTSSLRRKLFFQGDTSSVAPSPVKGGCFLDGGNFADLGSSPQVSPVKQLPEGWDQATPLKTPSRSQFSSSPIKNVKNVVTPKTSPPTADFLGSPELSPILYGHNRGSARSRTSGLFVQQDESFVEGDIQLSDQGSPSFLPSQPRFDLQSPENGKDPATTSLQSPGVSPIRPDSPQCVGDADGSFLQEKLGFTSDDSDVDHLTPVANIVTKEKRKTTSLRKVSHLSRHKQRNIMIDFEADKSMDYEQMPMAKNLRFADDIKTSSLLITRDISCSDMDYTQENIAASTNQDTGYQTASLQSTNQDAGHTNLTTQFSSLPFNLTSQDIAATSQDSVSFSLNQDQLGNEDSAFVSEENILNSDTSKPIVKKLLDLTNPDQFDKVSLSEDEILERARQALAMANSLLPNTSQDSGHGFHQKGLQILHELEPIVSQSAVEAATTDTGPHYETASDKALAILRRAGEDLNKYGHLM